MIINEQTFCVRFISQAKPEYVSNSRLAFSTIQAFHFLKQLIASFNPSKSGK